ncbi:MAG TPA: tRNA epoxyqueuosine(34) reductase QueG [Candidatus Nitrosotenuis sp.]|nr:tRNA epoxyqueuosine(34) reductase QueG [Candidatus Nitrosotenuis sp.]
MNAAAEKTRWVTEQARALGFDLCGVARAEDFPELERLPEWLARGYAGEMKYLHDARRRSPASVLPGAKSIIVCAMNYNTGHPLSTEVGADPGVRPEGAHAGAPLQENAPRGWISRYAWGDDYHDVFGEKLDALVAAMRAEFTEPFDARAYVDTGPVHERIAAKRAGLGWLAKNTLLINEQLGSWLLLGVILTTMELAPSLAPGEPPPADLCGQCTLCIEACPTGAIFEPYMLDARRCISYLTIELRGPIPEEFHAAIGRNVFGCDICQDVCPWNRKAPVTKEARFQPRRIANGESLLSPPLDWLAALTEEEFRKAFRGSAVKRAKWQGLTRNAQVALNNAGGLEHK